MPQICKWDMVSLCSFHVFLLLSDTISSPVSGGGCILLYLIDPELNRCQNVHTAATGL